MQCLSLAYCSYCPSFQERYSRRHRQLRPNIHYPSGSHTILVFFHTKLWQYSDGDSTPITRRRMQGVWKHHDFRPISRFISKIVQDRAIVFWVTGHFSTSPENWTVRAFLQLTPRLSNDFTAAWLAFTFPQLSAVAATLKSNDYNVARTFILNNNNNNNPACANLSINIISLFVVNSWPLTKYDEFYKIREEREHAGKLVG